MDFIERYVRVLHDRSKLVILLVLLLTAGVGYGTTMAGDGFVIAGFETDSPEAEAADYVDANFDTGDEAVTTLVVLRDRSGADEAVSRAALVESLRVQRAIRENETVAPTLDGPNPTFGVANAVAYTALARADGPPPEDPTIEEQIEAVEGLSEAETEAIVTDLASGEGDADVLALLPSDVDPASGSAEATLIVVTQDRGDPGNDELPPELVDAQVAIYDLTADHDASAAGEGIELFAFGPGIVDELSGQATGESFAFLGPVAMLLVVGLLAAAYRDVIDVVLGLAGIALVLVWMAGFVGWLGIEFTQILIAVPFLLIGLSIDYALHVVMRYREERADPEVDVATASARGLTGVVVAIGATTVTTAIGFFSNLTSDIGSISDFGLLSGLGILAAFVVFGALLPAVKYEIESALVGYGFERRQSALGTGGVTARVLGVGATLAKRAPVAVVVVVLLLSLAGGYGAVNVDTSIDQNDFLPEERPGWMEQVPEPVRPGDYQLQNQARYLDANFGAANADSDVSVLVRGDVTDPATLRAVREARGTAADAPTTLTYANGDAAVETPLTALDRVAARNETVATRLAEADTNGDGVPDRDVAAVFDAAFGADAETMGAVVARSESGNGAEYKAVRLVVTVEGDAAGADVLADARAVASVAGEPEGVSAIATGQRIVLEVVQESVLRTLVTTFTVTLLLVGVFLTLLFGRRHGRYSLGPVTMVPVVLALSWVLGMMYLLDIPYNTETAIITGIAIGIGVDFAIHIAERYVQERELGEDADGPATALQATVEGTGGALLASAATTVVGFGILTLTLVPSLQRFGAVTALTIAFAWVASVFVLPSLLLLWDRNLGYTA